MIIVPLAVLWAGYQLSWYGFSLLRGPGVGFLDLMLPQRASNVDSAIKGWGKSSAGQPTFGAPSYVNQVGVQPGSVFYPANPNGGLPSKPPLGKTPPAGYG